MFIKITQEKLQKYELVDKERKSESIYNGIITFIRQG